MIGKEISINSATFDAMLSACRALFDTQATPSSHSFQRSIKPTSATAALNRCRVRSLILRTIRRFSFNDRHPGV